jgi:hypothetical protein
VVEINQALTPRAASHREGEWTWTWAWASILILIKALLSHPSACHRYLYSSGTQAQRHPCSRFFSESTPPRALALCAIIGFYPPRSSRNSPRRNGNGLPYPDPVRTPHAPLPDPSRKRRPLTPTPTSPRLTSLTMPVPRYLSRIRYNCSTCSTGILALFIN